MLVNYYEVLNVSRNATEGEIRKAYNKLQKEYHPDKNLSEEENILLSKAADSRVVLSQLEKEQKKQIDNKLAKFREKFDEVKKAYEILSDPKQRSAHDKVLEEELRRLESFYPRYVDLLKQGKFEEVKDLLKKGKISLDKILEVSVDPDKGEGYTILHWAAGNNRPNIFAALKPYIKAKHIENYKYMSDITSLHYALDRGNIDIVEFILNIPNININAIEDSCIGNKGCAGSSLIISAKNSDLLFMLIEKGLDTQNPRAQENLLTLAVKFVEKNDVHSLDALLSKKIIRDIDAINYENNSSYSHEYGTILHAVVKNKNIEMMKMFIKHQPDVNRNYDGTTLLHFFCKEHKKDVIILLTLLFNADLTLKDDKRKTPLDYLEDKDLKKDLEDVAKLRDNISKAHGDAATNFILQHFEKNSGKSIEDCIKDLDQSNDNLSTSLSAVKAEKSDNKLYNYVMK